MTSMRRNDVASTSFRRHVPTRFLINQCQIIIFLILKSDIIENSRIELRGIVLPVPSNQIKVAFIMFYPSTWYICDFFLFHVEIEGKGGWIIGGAKGYVGPPPLKLLGGPGPPPPPSSYAQTVRKKYVTHSFPQCLVTNTFANVSQPIFRVYAQSVSVCQRRVQM